MTPVASATPRPAPPSHILVHAGGTVQRYYAQHFQGAIFPLAAGMLLYGWRVGLVVGVVVGTAVVATILWRGIGRRGRDLTLAHAAWTALLLALALPAHLGTFNGIASVHAVLWIAISAGFLLGIVLWVLRGPAGTALHPVVVTYLLLVPFFHDLLVPQNVLQRDHLFIGDVLDAPGTFVPLGTSPWWFTREKIYGHDAVRAETASETLLNYTLGRREMSARGIILLPGLLRDRLPPLEDLVVAGNPGPIGTSSVIFVIVGGLFLLYRGVIDYRIPVLIVASAFIALLILPIPVSLTEIGARWSWLPMHDPSVGRAVAVTFANYEMAASPGLFMALFLATSPTVRPITRRGRTVFAIAVGILTAAMQLYVSVSWGPYAALLLIGLLTPVVDWLFKPRPLA